MMNISTLFENRDKLTIHLTSSRRLIIAAMILIGTVVFIAGLITGHEQRTWSALLFNVFFFFNIALIGLSFANMQDIIAARWGRPVKKLHEGFGAFLPVAAVMMVAFLLAVKFDFKGAESVYPWMGDPHMLDHFWGKKTWLQKDFFIYRNIFAVVGIAVLASWHLGMVKKRDQLFLNGKREEALKYGEYVSGKLRYWSGPILVFYALAFSLLGFDLLMSISPLWFSTLWGGWLFAVGMQSMLATLLLILLWLRERSEFKGLINTQQLHDVGKLLYGFTIFFTYLTYAHVLTYWYGNVPEETEYFIHRMHAPWTYFITIIPLFVFVLPLFALIPKAAKYTKGYTHFICAAILISQWCVMLLIVMPESVHLDGSTYIPFLEIGNMLLVFGLFAWRWLDFSSKSPVVGPADPLLVYQLAEDHH